MTKSDLDKLFERVEDGLSSSELESVVEAVETSSDPTLQRRGLHILGWAHATEYTSLIASFLERRDNLGLPEMAIRALVLWFNNARPYLQPLKAFLNGIPEDEERDLQLVAVQVAGEAYRETGDLDLLGSIVQFLDDGDLAFRNSSRDALVNALTPNWNELSPRERHDLRRSFSVSDYPEQARRLLTHPGA